MAERLIVIGGDAAGMSAASQARRRRPDLEIVALERGRRTSYSACGIPYHVGGEVETLDELVARTPQEFRASQRIDVRIEHEAVGVDLDARKVTVRDHVHGREILLGFDQLMIGTGARPFRPDLPGIDLDHVKGAQTLADAEELLAHARESRCTDVVVVGGGYIGLELAEAFTRWGAEVAVVEAAPQVMGSLEPEMAGRVVDAMRRHGVDVHLETPVEAIEPEHVVAGGRSFRADLVVLGLGVAPNSGLAAEAGIELGERDAIAVDRRQRTSAEGVWAAGDCATAWNLVSRRQSYVPLGTVANRQGRVAGINIAGGYATFPGVLATAVSRFCDLEVGRTGLSRAEAAAAGIEVVDATIESTTTASYLPDAEPITVELLAELGSRRVVGAQIVGGRGSAKRVDVVATAITAGMTVDELVDVDLSYAPPFSPLWDPVAVAARRASSLLDESMRKR
ncbi:MAG: FAD-dependent oxidoreductase [Actinomycetota bacterium]|nr:FAD-dependent oxidoreductase [Actinomycetota bacterium]